MVWVFFPNEKILGHHNQRSKVALKDRVSLCPLTPWFPAGYTRVRPGLAELGAVSQLARGHPWARVLRAAFEGLEASQPNTREIWERASRLPHSPC